MWRERQFADETIARDDVVVHLAVEHAHTAIVFVCVCERVEKERDRQPKRERVREVYSANDLLGDLGMRNWFPKHRQELHQDDAGSSKDPAGRQEIDGPRGQKKARSSSLCFLDLKMVVHSST